jgi:hypothetical protein
LDSEDIKSQVKLLKKASSKDDAGDSAAGDMPDIMDLARLFECAGVS